MNSSSALSRMLGQGTQAPATGAVPCRVCVRLLAGYAVQDAEGAGVQLGELLEYGHALKVVAGLADLRHRRPSGRLGKHVPQIVIQPSGVDERNHVGET